MSQFDDLPLIRCRPTPSDAELEAERDAKHAKAVADFDRTGGVCGCYPVECWGYCDLIGEVFGL